MENLYKVLCPHLDVFENNLLKNSCDPQFVKEEIMTLLLNLKVVDFLNFHLNLVLNGDIKEVSLIRSDKLILVDNKVFSVGVFFNIPRFIDDEKGVLYSLSNDLYMGLIEGATTEVDYTVYSQSGNIKMDELDYSVRLNVKESSVLSKGHVLYVKAYEEILRLDKSKPIAALMVYFKTELGNYSWEYDAKSLSPKRLVLNNRNFARIAVTAKILGNLGLMESKDSLIRLISHESHVIRWEAARALVNVDFTFGKNCLLRLCTDLHPEVREAAIQSLNILNSKEIGDGNFVYNE